MPWRLRGVSGASGQGLYGAGSGGPTRTFYFKFRRRMKRCDLARAGGRILRGARSGSQLSSLTDVHSSFVPVAHSSHSSRHTSTQLAAQQHTARRHGSTQHSSTRFTARGTRHAAHGSPLAERRRHHGTRQYEYARHHGIINAV